MFYSKKKCIINRLFLNLLSKCCIYSFSSLTKLLTIHFYESGHKCIYGCQFRELLTISKPTFGVCKTDRRYDGKVHGGKVGFSIRKRALYSRQMQIDRTIIDRLCTIAPDLPPRNPFNVNTSKRACLKSLLTILHCLVLKQSWTPNEWQTTIIYIFHPNVSYCSSCENQS